MIMLIRSRYKEKAQGLLDYVIVVGIVASVFFAMSVFVRRGIQGVVKSAADQIGVQKDAEQAFDSNRGFLVESTVRSSGSTSKQTNDTLGTRSYNFNENTTSETESTVNLGFTETADF